MPKLSVGGIAHGVEMTLMLWLGCRGAMDNAQSRNVPAAMVESRILNNFGGRRVSGTSTIVHRIL
jgi:hypothetical protein